MTVQAAPAANRVRAIYWALAALVLLLPAIAMNLSAEVAWGPGDFALMAALLGMVGLGIELALRAALTFKLRALAIAAMVGMFLLVWAELAVGLFD
ncbi:hypothetical protein K3148_06980 [Qipengyuania aurantiaca]|uniref:Uncharacterized protein n=1 Tax=Qipengyuania aurantiaca TaxID=2867233 RepID=A0ABX8ZN65_9SPHN|nr:hypothetical protein [Qipengyuania aurantiaca]QZD88623.1 hypothetical protein K3148_06980 [Qipengyuania aurantiaca]